MKKNRINFNKIVMSFLALLMAFSVSLPVYAEGTAGQLSTSLSSVENGKTIVITFKAVPAVSIENYETEIHYNSSLFQYVAGSAKNLTTLSGGWEPDTSSTNGVIKVGTFGTAQPNVSKLCQLTFKAIATGTAKFSTAKSVINTEEPANYSISVTVIDALPSNNNLTSLSVNPGALSPAFSTSQTNYAVAVETSVSKLSVSAVASDSKARVEVSGNTDLKDGENKIIITVTAQNGAKKTYTITATRAAPSPTPEPTPSPSPSPTPAVTVQVSGGPWSITDLPPEVPIPEGFYRTLTNISGQMVPTFKSFKGDLVLYYLANQAGEAGFYYYDSTKAAYQAYLMLTIPTQSFSVLSPDSSVSIPVGFNETEMLLNGNSYQAWQPDPATVKTAASDEYLLYLMNSQGDKGFYWYNKTTRLLSIYTVSTSTAVSEPAVTDGVTPLPQPDPVAATALDPWLLATILLGVLCLILLGLVIWLSFGSRRRRYNARSYSDEDGYDSWADLDDNDHDGHDHQAPPVKAPPIRRVE